MMHLHRHFILHKPVGYLSQFINNQTRRKNKKLLGMLHDFPDGTMSIGRLDQNSEGLLLLTTDGKISEKVRSKSVEKEYHIQVDGIIDDDAINQLQDLVEISYKGVKYQSRALAVHKLHTSSPYSYLPKKVRDERHGPTSWISITINEGKFRQVRKMSAAVGFPTLRLVRVRIGNVKLIDIEAGQVIEVNDFHL